MFNFFKKKEKPVQEIEKNEDIKKLLKEENHKIIRL